MSTILIIGTDNCVNCLKTKYELFNKGIDYDYFLIDELNDKDAEKYKNDALSKGLMSFPILVKDGKVVSKQDILQYRGL